jgi:hypothetical protein
MPHDLHALLSFHHQRFQHAFRYSSRRSRKYHGSRKRGIEKNRLQQQQHQQHQQHLLAQQVGRQQAAGPGGLDPMEDQQDCQIWYSWGWGGKAIEQEWQGSQQEEDIWKSLQP